MKYCVVILLIILSPSIYAEIIPDGSTTTTIEHSSLGTIVHIAPVNSYGVSLNAYQTFNIDVSGVEIDNVSERAHTIVHAINSNQLSYILGSVHVSGPKANMIISNPAGIVVNGSECFNTQTLTLTTQNPFEFENNQPPHSLAEIIIHEQGLRVEADELQLHAKHHQFNGMISPTDDSPLGAVTIHGAVDTSHVGGAEADHIQINMTENGENMNHAGVLIASRSDLNIETKGDLNIQGGRLLSAEQLKLHADNIVIESLENHSAGIKSFNQNIEIQAEKTFQNRDAIIDAKQNVHILAPTRIENTMTFSEFEGRSQKHFFKKNIHRWFFPGKKQGFSIDYGTQRIPNSHPVITAQHFIELNSDEIINHGGEINADEITFHTKHLRHLSPLFGTYDVEKRCAWNCRITGESHVGFYPALIHAKKIHWMPDLELFNQGGFIEADTAHDGLHHIHIENTPIHIPQFTTFEGIYPKFFGRHHGHWHLRAQNGVIL